MNPHPQNTQSVEELIHEFENLFVWVHPEDEGGSLWKPSAGKSSPDKAPAFLRTALTTAIESERERILNILKDEIEDEKQFSESHKDQTKCSLSCHHAGEYIGLSTAITLIKITN